jgi:hypothetical protein
VLTYFVTVTQAGREEIEASYSDISQVTGLCRQSVQEGLNRAIEQGYLRLVQPSTFFSSASYQVLGIGCQVSGDRDQPSEEEAAMLAEADALLGIGGQVSGDEYEDQVGSSSVGMVEPYPNYAYQKNEVSPTFQTCTTFHTTPPPNSNIEINRIEDRIESSKVVKKLDHAENLGQSPTYPPEVIHISAYLTNLSHDFSLELGDPTHTRSNRTQIHNLWHKSGLPEKEFVAVMYEARKLTKQFAIIRQGEKEPPPGQTRNRMAYFFAVLRDMLGLPAEKKNPVTQKTSENHRETRRYKK